jgi:hypothetical protein
MARFSQSLWKNLADVAPPLLRLSAETLTNPPCDTFVEPVDFDE